MNEPSLRRVSRIRCVVERRQIEQMVVEAVLDTYTEEGARIWMNSVNRRAGGVVPIVAIRKGPIADARRVLNAALSLRGQVAS